MKYLGATIVTLSLLLLPAVSLAQIDPDPHTNIPDTDRLVAHEIEQFTRFVNDSETSQAELFQALTDIHGLLESYKEILNRRSN